MKPDPENAPRHLMSTEHRRQLAALLRRPGVSVGIEAASDRPFIHEVKASHPGLDRSITAPEFVAGEEVIDRWIHVVVLRGLQIKMASQGFQVLLLGGLEAPFIAVHRNLEPLAVRSIPPDEDILFAPDVLQDECNLIAKAMDDAAAASLGVVAEVARSAPVSGDVFAEHVWRACRAIPRPSPPLRSAEDERRVGEYVALFHGRPRYQQIEMALSLSDRVLMGKDKPHERQIQAGAADQMWRELGAIDWAQIDSRAAARGGWLRVANLGTQEESERYAFIEVLKDAMARICQDGPVDVEVKSGATVRVYRFLAGQRTLIDRQSARRGRVH